MTPIAQNFRLLHNGERIQLSTDDVLYLQSDVNYTIFYTADKRTIISSRHLGMYAEALDGKSFIRINKSYLLNRKYLDRFLLKRDGSKAFLSDGTVLDISRRQATNIRRMKL
ncbi:MAG: LytR/AlgR family response regulator transcription factor [Spirosomataceae bacterium]